MFLLLVVLYASIKGFFLDFLQHYRGWMATTPSCGCFVYTPRPLKSRFCLRPVHIKLVVQSFRTHTQPWIYPPWSSGPLSTPPSDTARINPEWRPSRIMTLIKSTSLHRIRHGGSGQKYHAITNIQSPLNTSPSCVSLVSQVKFYLHSILCFLDRIP